MNARVSVIIPFYNSGEYLSAAIASLRNQTIPYEQLQIILVDDGSTSTGSTYRDIVREFADDNQISIYHMSHSGPSAARNYGISKATGEFLMFLDSDDAIDPDYLKQGLDAAERFPSCDMFYFPMKIMGDSVLDWNRVHFTKSTKIALYDYNVQAPKICPSNVASSLIRRECVSDKIRFNTNMKYGEDAYFNAMCMLRNLKLCCINTGQYYERRKRDGSLTTQHETKAAFSGAACETMWWLPQDAFSLYEKTPARVRYLEQFIRNVVTSRMNKLEGEYLGDEISETNKTVLHDALLNYCKHATELPLISLIVPCHNSIGTLDKIISKLKHQSLKEWECICVDDTQDSSLVMDFLLNHAAKDPRIKVLKNDKNPGAGASRNMGLSIARGRYVWFIDSDDELSILNDGLKNICDKMRAYPGDFHIFPTAMWINNKYVNSFLDVRASDLWYYKKEIVRREDIVNQPDRFKSFLQLVKMNPWCKILDHEFLLSNQDKVWFQNTHFSNDNHFSVGILKYFSSFACHSTNPIYRYNRTSTSISNPKTRSEYLSDIGLLLDWIVQLNDSDAFEQAVLVDRLNSIETILNQIEQYRERRGIQRREEFLDELVGLLSNKLPDRLCEFFNTHPILKYVYDHKNDSNAKSQSTDRIPPITIKESADVSSTSLTNGKHDAVFVLGDGSMYRDLELMLAIHSMRKFCPFIDRIFIVGNKPRCSLVGMNCECIQCKDPYVGSKDANIMFKVLHAINSIPDLTDNFLLCSDDQLVTQPCTWDDFKPKYIKKITSDEMQEMKHRGVMNNWTSRLIRTLDAVLKRNGSAWFYEPHIWSPFNKESFRQMVSEIGGLRNAGVIMSQYYNSIADLDHEKIHDHKFFNSYSLDWSENFKNPPKFIAYNDKAFISEEFRNQLIMLVK